MSKLIKPIIALITSILGTNNSVFSQLSPGAIDSAKTEIIKLSSDWNSAIKNKDSALLDRILASDFTLNGSVNKTGWLSNTIAYYEVDTISFITPLNVTVYGQVAKVESTLYWKADWKGKPRINGEYLITDVWIKRKDQWQVLTRMSALAKKRE